MSIDLVRRTAQTLVTNARIESVPVDVKAAANFVGLTIRYVDAPPGFSGRLLRARLVVEVNRAHHRHRQRFTIGHEIGHFELGHDPVSCAFDDYSRRDPHKTNEWQAHVFAGELLMPEALLRARWAEVKDYKALAAEFAVSPEAMWRQLETLDLLGLPPGL